LDSSIVSVLPAFDACMGICGVSGHKVSFQTGQTKGMSTW